MATRIRFWAIFWVFHLFSTALAQASATPHLVFLVHGLSQDSKSTFGAMAELLSERLKSQDKSTDFSFVPLDYETLHKKKTPIHFAGEIHEQILREFDRRKLPHGTPFSLIMHSQGGVVGLRYVDLCIGKSQKLGPQCPRVKFVGDQDTGRSVAVPPNERRSAPTNLRNFITLGAPLWGSNRAANFKDKWIKLLVSHHLDNPEQMRQLAYGSVGLTVAREAFSSIFHGQSSRGPFPPYTRVIDFAGDLSEMQNELTGPVGGLTRSFLSLIGESRLESDIAVEVPSARLDFHYRVEEGPDSPQAGKVWEGTTAVAERFIPLKLCHGRVKLGPLLVFEGLNWFDRPSSSFQPKSDLVVQYIAQALSGEPIESQDIERQELVSNQLETFISEVKINLPVAYQRKLLPTAESGFVAPELLRKLLKIREAPGIRKVEEPLLPNTFLSTHSGINPDFDGKPAKHFQTFVHTGVFDDRWSYRPSTQFEGPRAIPESKLSYQIRVPGWLPKDFQVKVSPSYTSFSEITLTPWLPIPVLGSVKNDPRALTLAPSGDFRQLVSAYLKPGVSGKSRVLQLITMNPETFTLEGLTVDPTSLKTRSGQTVTTPDRTGLSRSLGRCFPGVVGQILGVHRGVAESRFAATPAKRWKMPQGTRLEVLGRYHNRRLSTRSATGFQIAEIDRYLVTSKDPSFIEAFGEFRPPTPEVPEGTGLAWVNLVDIDVVADASPCSFVDLQAEPGSLNAQGN